MIYGALFGGGVGIFIIMNYTYFYGLTIIESNATDMVPGFFVSLTALIVFAVSGIVL